MRIPHISGRLTKALICLTILLVTFTFFKLSSVSSDTILQIPSLTVATDKQSYYLREKITLSGTFTENGSPITDVLVAIDIRDPKDYYVAFRTLPIGNPDESWAIEYVETSLTDMGDNPIDSAKIETQVKPSVTIYNTLGNVIEVYATITVYDGTLIPIFASWSKIQLAPVSTAKFSWSVYIPEWAHCGKALIFYNVYTDLPKNGGIPYAPEHSDYFYIKRNEELGNPYSPPISTYTTSPGEYNLYFRLSPDRYARKGTYTAYVVGRISPIYILTATTTFTMQTYPCPPQAAFTYTPLQIYQNMTVTFDASSSSAEGYNDTIIRYEWFFNDPYNPEHIINEGDYENPPSPLAQHTFEYDGTYTVELNVTDNEGLWCTTAKQVVVLPEFPPTANFTWTPEEPIVNSTVIFNASSSQPGWSAQTQEFSPIVSYEWNFSDGTGIHVTSDPIIQHNFTQPNNYTVTLTIFDEAGRSDTISYLIEVFNVTAKTCDVVEDGVINMKDIYAAILAYGSEPGDPNWNPRADVIKDDTINMKDIFQIILHYGEDP